MEFRNQPVTDILLVLAEVSRQSIIPDDTVEGNATYLFHNMPFEEALARFLENQDLYFVKKNDVYYISRIHIDYDPALENLSLQTEGTDIQKIIKKISQTLGTTILYDALPREEITLQFENGTVESLLNIIIRRYSDYSIETGEDYYYIRRNTSGRNTVNQYGGNYFTLEDNLFSADLKKVRFRDVLADLMIKGGYEYSMLGQNDSIIERFSFKDKTFTEILDLLLEQANSGYEISNGIYYFFDKDRQDILNKFVSTVRIPLIKNSADGIVSLIPDYIMGEAVIKKDALANNVIISGPMASLVPLESYIIGLENDLPGYSWNRFDLNFLVSGEIASFLPDTYSSHTSINLEEGNAFLMYMSREKADALREFLRLVDVPGKVTPVYLDYISAEDLMDNIPPSIDEERVSLSSDENLVFFRGNAVQLEHFKDTI
ncbi:MAG: hypothetical protein PQJ50_14095, partial [Spirochaetales bacterium]|nr:hypothetical protein [Spirochaetales bacterium]